MKLIVISIFLFCLVFALAIPMKIENDKLADLILQEESLKDSVSMMRYGLSMVEKSIDSLSSRNRIDNMAVKLGLEESVVATKITRYAK